MELINKKIRWLLNDDIDLDSASHRLRCFHFARYLEEKYNYDSIFYKDAIYLAKFLTKGDKVKIIKNLDIEINRVVLRAYYLNIPVIVDICDNLIDPYYKKNEFLVANYNLISLSKFITKITVPNFTLKTIIKDCLKIVYINQIYLYYLILMKKLKI